MKTLQYIVLFLFSLASQAQDITKLHENAIVIDTHNDVLWRVLNGEDISIRTTNGHSDLVRWKEGGLDAQFFSIWCGGDYGKGTAYARANQLIDSLDSIIKRNPEKIELARTSKDVLRIVKKHKLAALIGVEGGHMIEDNLDYLDALAKRGMRYLTLTWNNSTSWSTSAADETEKGDSLAFKGLTAFGKKVVARLNELGVMVDLSHVGERTFWDAIAVTKKPVIVSHSSVYTICPNRRNLKDDQIKAIKKNNGVICVNFYSGFIDSSYDRKYQELRKQNKPLVDSLRSAVHDRERVGEILDSILAPQYKKICPTISQVIDHIDYIVKLIGVDYVGLGGDFDGVESVPIGLDDVTKYPNITRELKKRGYSDKDIIKILGGNVLRVLRANAG